MAWSIFRDLQVTASEARCIAVDPTDSDTMAHCIDE
jgi:hypothetical protein